MTPERLQHLERQLKTWREKHPDLASCRAAYRRRMVEFTLNSMAMEGERVEPVRLMAMLRTPARQHDR